MSRLENYPAPDPNGKNIGFVIQGPLSGRHVDVPGKYWHVKDCIRSIRQHFKDAQIVVSTWKGEDCEGLDVDMILQNDDPGRVHNTTRCMTNFMRQLVSTREGLEAIAHKVDFLVKFRGDFLVRGVGFQEAHERYSRQSCEERVFSAPIIGLNYFTLHPARGEYLFSWSDLIHYGRTSDILSLWSIDAPPVIDRLVDEDGTRSYKTSCELLPEQYVWVMALGKYRDLRTMSHFQDFSSQLKSLHEGLLIANFVPMEPSDFGVHWIGREETMKRRWSRIYSFNEWLRLRRMRQEGRFLWPDAETMLKYLCILPKMALRKGRKLLKR